VIFQPPIGDLSTTAVDNFTRKVLKALSFFLGDFPKSTSLKRGILKRARATREAPHATTEQR
jgi:hypothetical protein